MVKYILSCESTSDIRLDYAKKRGISLIANCFSIGVAEYQDSMGQDPNEISEIVKALKGPASGRPSTRPIDETTYYEYFKGLLEQGYNILHLTLSTGLTDGYENAIKAAKKLNVLYPNNHVEVIDSLCGAGGYGILVDDVKDYMEQGHEDVKDLVAYIMENRLKMHHVFYCTDLSHFRKSGYISFAKSAIGTLFNFNILLMLNSDGKIVQVDKIRHEEEAREWLCKKMEFLADNGEKYMGKVWICHVDNPDGADELEKLIKANFPNIRTEINVQPFDPTISSHVGPGCVGVFFHGCDRKKYGNA